MGCALALSSWLLMSCNGDDKPVGTPVFVAGAPATHGVFDAALTQDVSGGLWMSYSTVNFSSNDPVLPRVDTRIASSSNAGNNWTDTGVAPYTPPGEFQLPHQGSLRWAAWQYEVSRILYDASAPPNLRWKLFWHRYLRPNFGGPNDSQFQHGWIGVATASAPTGPWSPERNLLVGTFYDSANNVILGAPEYTSASLAISDCPIFTEPGALAVANNIYISLKCAGGTVGKVVLLRCNNDLTGCTYRGDLLLNSEAAQFTPIGQSSYDGFSATELVTVNSIHYLIVTPTFADAYRGCLVFQIADLNTAALVRRAVSGTPPVLIKSVSGTPGSFNGACGYTAAASASGIIYSEFQILGGAPQFGLYRSGVTLP